MRVGRLGAKYAAWTCAVLALAGSCAPPPPAELTAGSKRDHYLAALDRRQASAEGLNAAAALWLRPASGKRLPGVLSDLEIERAERFRLTVSQPLGIALQIGGEGRHVVVLLPTRRAVFESDDVGDSIGLDRPADFLVRSVTALWRPDDAAWSDTGAGLLSWSDAGASLALEIDARGRPARVRVGTGRAGALRIAYFDWFESLGTEWPGRIEIEDSSSTARLTCRIERLRRLTESERWHLAITIPKGARHLEWEDLVRELTRRKGS